VRAQLGDKTNWSDSEDLAMMFQGTYNNEFYHALHDALHAQVEQWGLGHGDNEGNMAGDAAKAKNAARLWHKVETLEETCRNPQPTVLREIRQPDLVQLRTLGDGGDFPRSFRRCES
jgi:hypothetical protein